MKEKLIIKNFGDVVDQLAGMLMQFDVSSNGFETDVYLYVEDGKARLETFENVGGNFYRKDDHYTIHKDGPHYEPLEETFLDGCSSMEEVYGILFRLGCFDENEIMEDVLSDYLEECYVPGQEYNDQVWGFIEYCQDRYDMKKVRRRIVDGLKEDYWQSAWDIMENFINEGGE